MPDLVVPVPFTGSAALNSRFGHECAEFKGGLLFTTGFSIFCGIAPTSATAVTTVNIPQFVDVNFSPM